MKSAIVLAAGKGTRMKSSLGKVMHPILHKPMIGYIIDTLKASGVERIIVVVGHEKEQIQAYLKDEVEYAIQEPQLGTGHAIMQVKQLAASCGQTILLCGDGPLIQKETIQKAFSINEKAACSIVSAVLNDGAQYGRIIRDQNNEIERIVEFKDCSAAQKKIKEINTGIFCFDNELLFKNLKHLKNENKQREYYVTDLVEILYRQKLKVNSFVIEDPQESMGINDRYDLACASKRMQAIINQAFMREGVSFIDPEHTYIDRDVQIGEDTTIYPNVHICKHSKIGKRVIIKPNSWIEDAQIGDDVVIENSVIKNSSVDAHAQVGPMAHIRDGCHIYQNTRVGNFVEFKNSQLGDDSKCAHLTYIGDCRVGKNVNIGCGVVSVNYDGVNKFQSTIKDGAFIGSNVNLIAPITVGENAVVAAGSTIDQNVEDGDMAIARGRQVNKKGKGLQYKTK